MENMKDIVCNNFIRLTEKSDLSFREIAKRVGVNENTLQRWKNKKSFPERPNIEKLAIVLDVDVTEFYRTDDPPILPKSFRVSDITEYLGAVPDKVFELAQKVDRDNKVWEAISGLLEIEAKKTKKNSKLA